jgi:glycyl-tRNA synthetase beta subunit
VVQPLLEAHNYTDALSQLASLREPIDAFFDNVMVMAEDPNSKPIAYVYWRSYVVYLPRLRM